MVTNFAFGKYQNKHFIWFGVKRILWTRWLAVLAQVSTEALSCHVPLSGFCHTHRHRYSRLKQWGYKYVFLGKERILNVIVLHPSDYFSHSCHLASHLPAFLQIPSTPQMVTFFTAGVSYQLCILCQTHCRLRVLAVTATSIIWLEKGCKNYLTWPVHTE